MTAEESAFVIKKLVGNHLRFSLEYIEIQSKIADEIHKIRMVECDQRCAFYKQQAEYSKRMLELSAGS